MAQKKDTPPQGAKPKSNVSVSIPQSDDMCDWALLCAAMGWPVFPLVPRDKTPLTEHGYLDASTDPDVIRAWWTRWPDANVGVATGLSGLVIIDIDRPEAVQTVKRMGMPHAPHARTTKGWHLWCVADPGRPLSSRAGILPGVDIRAHGGYVVAPPSVHPSGKRYEWAPGRTPWDMELPPAPEWLYDMEAQRGKTDMSALADGATEGMRDESLASVAGHLLARHVEPHLAESLVYAYGTHLCTPPLSERQIRKVWQSIASRELRQREKRGRG